MGIDAEALFAEHHETLFRYLVRLTGDPELAADATQEAFVRLIEKAPADLHPRAWLFRVATNHARETARTDIRHRRLQEAAGTRLAPEQAATPEAVTDARHDAERVRRALDSLDPRDRTVLLMREEGFAHREIAAAVDTTTGSVGTMIARALAKLASVLDPEATP
jgi:RNA polymerase sigma-70 factor (ECF subfamily)